MPLPTFTAKTDGVDVIHAVDVNELQNEVSPTAAAALAVRYSTAHTSTATVLTDASFPLQSINPGAAATVDLPAVSTANHGYYVVNRSTSNTLTVKYGIAFVAYVRPSGAGVFFPDSTAGWYGLSLPRFSSSTSPQNVLREDGTLVNLSTIMASAGIGVPRWICKSTAETVNNSTALQDDDHLTFNLPATSTAPVWLLKFYLLVTAANTTADIKFAIAGSAVTSYSIGFEGDSITQNAFGGVAVASTPLAISTATIAAGTNAATVGMRINAIVVGTTSTGSVTLQWAQNTLSATNLTIQPNSVMEYVQVK